MYSVFFLHILFKGKLIKLHVFQATRVADPLTTTSPVKPASAKFDFEATSSRNNSNASELYSITENESKENSNHATYNNVKKRNSSSAKVVPLSDMISVRDEEY